MRLFVVTGAGGAGVSTFAGALAVAGTAHGQRTLLISREQPPVLAALFGRPAPAASFRVDTDRSKSLWCMSADLPRETADTWRAMQPWLEEAATAVNSGQLRPDLLAMLPDSRLLAALLALRAQAEASTFDVIVLDAGPTEALAQWLLLLDAAAGINLESNSEEGISHRIGRSLLRHVAGVPLPDETTRRAMTRLLAGLVAGRKVIGDRATTGLVVTVPGEIPARSQRPAVALLALAGLVPAGIWQRGTLAGPDATQVRRYAPVPVHHLPHLGEEPMSVSALATLAGQAHLIDRFATPRPPVDACTTPSESSTEWRQPLPYVSPDRLQISQDRTGIIIEIPGGRRKLFLSPALADQMCVGARLDAGILHLRFAPAAPAAGG